MSESGIKRQWNEVRAASKLTWFRQYDCRHTGITRLAEAATHIGVIMDLAGHVSVKMMRHYTHISEAEKTRAMQNVQRRASFRRGYQPPSTMPAAPVDPAALIGQLLQQCGMTTEQLRDAQARCSQASSRGPKTT